MTTTEEKTIADKLYIKYYEGGGPLCKLRPVCKGCPLFEKKGFCQNFCKKNPAEAIHIMEKDIYEHKEMLDIKSEPKPSTPDVTRMFTPESGCDGLVDAVLNFRCPITDQLLTALRTITNPDKVYDLHIEVCEVLEDETSFHS